MPEDPQERRRREIEAAPPETSDALIVMQENARKIREESARLKAERDKQEQFQRDRQAAHERAARQVDEEVRAQIFLRVMQTQQAREQEKLQAEASLGPPNPQFRNTQLELEQEAGRRTLARHRGERAASVEKETGKDSAPGTPGFKT